VAAATNYIIAPYSSIDNVPGVQAVDNCEPYVGY
jgi:SLT domain-containing protein